MLEICGNIGLKLFSLIQALEENAGLIDAEILMQNQIDGSIPGGLNDCSRFSDIKTLLPCIVQYANATMPKVLSQKILLSC